MRIPVMISICDLTGNMARPWAEAGCVCVCIDIQHSIRRTKSGNYKIEKFEGGGEIHFMYGDARAWKPEHFDADFFRKYRVVFVSCFPTCTNLAGSGSQDWLMKGLAMLTDGLMLFNSCQQIASWSGAKYIIENPSGTITKHLRAPDYTFDPWNYGDPYQKKTCLWTGNGFIMPEFQVKIKPEGTDQRIHTASPGENRANERSETPMGFAYAVKEANYKSLKSFM